MPQTSGLLSNSSEIRGAEVGKALFVEYYEELPQSGSGGKKREAREARMQAALDRFKKSVQARYTEGTLLRVLDSTARRHGGRLCWRLAWLGP